MIYSVNEFFIPARSEGIESLLVERHCDVTASIRLADANRDLNRVVLWEPIFSLDSHWHTDPHWETPETGHIDERFLLMFDEVKNIEQWLTGVVCVNVEVAISKCTTVNHWEDISIVFSSEDSCSINLVEDDRVNELWAAESGVLHYRRRIELHVASVQLCVEWILTIDHVQTDTWLHIYCVAWEPTHTDRADIVSIVLVVANFAVLQHSECFLVWVCAWVTILVDWRMPTDSEGVSIILVKLTVKTHFNYRAACPLALICSKDDIYWTDPLEDRIDVVVSLEHRTWVESTGVTWVVCEDIWCPCTFSNLLEVLVRVVWLRCCTCCWSNVEVVICLIILVSIVTWTNPVQRVSCSDITVSDTA